MTTRYFADTMFANSLYAPGTPAGSSRFWRGLILLDTSRLLAALFRERHRDDCRVTRYAAQPQNDASNGVSNANASRRSTSAVECTARLMRPKSSWTDKKHMPEDAADLTLTKLIKQLWPTLSTEDREMIATARAKLEMLDTWTQTAAGRTETNYHGEAYEALRVLSRKLMNERPDDPFVSELFARYGAGKQPA